MISITTNSSPNGLHMVISRDRGTHFECVDNLGHLHQIPKTAITSTKENTTLRLPEIVSFLDRPKEFLTTLRTRRLNVMRELKSVLVKFETKGPKSSKSPKTKKSTKKSLILSPEAQSVMDAMNQMLNS
jgi:hypothetical protein